jgi:Na+/proline symporter
MLRIMRLSVVGVAFCSAIMALFNSNIYELVGSSSALSLVGLFMPLTAGLFWKGTSSKAANASMLTGMAVWIYFEYINPGDLPSLVPGLLTSIVTIIVGSWLFPDDSYAKFLVERGKSESPEMGKFSEI